jgi:hypothetical protein
MILPIGYSVPIAASQKGKSALSNFA